MRNLNPVSLDPCLMWFPNTTGDRAGRAHRDTCLIQIWRVLPVFDVRRFLSCAAFFSPLYTLPLNTISSYYLYTFVTHPALVVRVGCMVCVCARAFDSCVYMGDRWWKERVRVR